MNLKKRLISAGVAFSMLFSTMSVAPLSLTSWMQPVGIYPTAGAYSLDPPPVPQEVVDKMNSVASLIDPLDQNLVQTVKESLAESTNVDAVNDTIWPYIEARIASDIDPNRFDKLSPVSIFLLMREALKLTYADPTGIESLRVNPVHRPVMDQLALLGSDDGEVAMDLTPNDFVDFFYGLQDLVVQDSFGDLDFSMMQDLVQFNLENVLANDEFNLSRLMNNIGVPSESLLEMSDIIQDEVDPGRKGYNAVILAYVKDGLDVESSYSGNTIYFTPTFKVYDVSVPSSYPYLTWSKVSGDAGVDVSEDGTVSIPSSAVSGAKYDADVKLEVTYTDIDGEITRDLFTETMEFTYNGPDIEAPTAPTNLVASEVKAYSVKLNWTASSDNAIVFGYKIYVDGAYTADADTNSYTLTGLDSFTTYNIKVSAVDTADNESSFSNEISVKTISDAVTPVDPELIDNIFTNASSKIDQLKNTLASTTNPDKINELKSDIVKEFNNAANAAGALTIAPQINGNTVTLDTELIKQQVAYTISVINELANSVKNTVDSTKLTPSITLNLTGVTSSTANVVLDKALFDYLKSQGITTINLTFAGTSSQVQVQADAFITNNQNNGFSVALPTSGITSDITFSVIKKTATDFLSNKTSTYKTNYNKYATSVKSDIYTAYLSSSLASTATVPLTVRIPVSNTLDSKFVTLIKIVNGEKQVTPAKVVDGAIVKQVKLTNKTYDSFAAVLNNVTFNDIAPVQSWAGESINSVAAKGIINGKGAGKFDPKGLTTRAEFAKLLVVTYDLVDTKATANYKDVKSTNWFYPFVASAAKLGIVTGRANGNFDPNANMTREEMSVMIARTLKVLEKRKIIDNPSTILNAFTDKGSISGFATEGVAALVQLNILKGSNGKFNPKGKATRAETAVAIYRLFNSDN